MKKGKQYLIVELNNKAYEIRKEIIRLGAHAREGHCAPALSIVEIMSALYFHCLRVDPRKPDWPERDRFILSKGHGCLALYVTLCYAGFFDQGELYTFLQPGTSLAGHPISGKLPGVEASTGSLGHGLSIAAGIALAARMDKKDHRTFTVVGDGESNEGMVWEAAMVSAHQHLDNLTAIVDRNGFQCDGCSDNICRLDPVDEKWRSFGWEVKVCDGHKIGELMELLDSVPFAPGKPSLILANTVKGKGVKFMESNGAWHYRTPLDEEVEEALAVLENLND